MKSIPLVRQLTQDWRCVWVMPASSFSSVSVLLKPQHCILISQVFLCRLSFQIILIRATARSKSSEAHWVFSWVGVEFPEGTLRIFQCQDQTGKNICGFYKKCKNNICFWFQASFGTTWSTFSSKITQSLSHLVKYDIYWLPGRRQSS